MVKAKEIIGMLDEMFPVELRAKWDFTDGLLQGNIEKEVKKIGLSLEIRENLIDTDFDMLILHHPPKFGPEKVITNPFYEKLKNKDVIIYVLHSRLDKTGLVNKEIGKAIFGSKNLEVEKVLHDGTAIIKLVNEMGVDNMVELIKSKLKIPFVKTIVKKENIQKVAIHGGEGFNPHHVKDAVNENIDAYLAGDMTHHFAEGAFFNDVTFFDIEHFTEQEGMKKVQELLKESFDDCELDYIEQTSWWNAK